MRVLAVGINPSLHAVRAGFPFAFKHNRFWPALNRSLLLDEMLSPGVSATLHLLERHHIGFTDIVKRPTPGAADLRAADYATGAPLLADKIATVKPAVLWFHGKTSASAFCRYLVDDAVELGWGWQGFTYTGIRCFVSPNPSPANARFSLADITASYNELATGLG